MPAPARSFLAVTDTAVPGSCLKKDRQVPALDIAGWAINGEISLVQPLPMVDTADKQIASGIVEIDGYASRVFPTCILHDVKVGNIRP